MQPGLEIGNFQPGLVRCLYFQTRLLAERFDFFWGAVIGVFCVEEEVKTSLMTPITSYLATFLFFFFVVTSVVYGVSAHLRLCVRFPCLSAHIATIVGLISSEYRHNLVIDGQWSTWRDHGLSRGAPPVKIQTTDKSWYVRPRKIIHRTIVTRYHMVIPKTIGVKMKMNSRENFGSVLGAFRLKLTAVLEILTTRSTNY